MDNEERWDLTSPQNLAALFGLAGAAFTIAGQVLWARGVKQLGPALTWGGLVVTGISILVYLAVRE